jgi:hypothetical protein
LNGLSEPPADRSAAFFKLSLPAYAKSVPSLISRWVDRFVSYHHVLKVRAAKQGFQSNIRRFFCAAVTCVSRNRRKGGTGILKIGKTLSIGTGTVQRVLMEQPRPVDVAEAALASQ